MFCYVILSTAPVPTTTTTTSWFLLSVRYLSGRARIDRQRQGEVVVLPVWQISAHKFLSTVCMSSPLPLHDPHPQSLHRFKEWRNPMTLLSHRGESFGVCHRNQKTCGRYLPTSRFSPPSVYIPVVLPFGLSLPQAVFEADSRHRQALPAVGSKHLGNGAVMRLKTARETNRSCIQNKGI